MADDGLEIPGFLDARRNGRCRAWWTAHERCPGNRNPYEYAQEHMHKYVEEAARIDNKEGMLPCCRPGKQRVKKSSMNPIRTRTRAKG